MADFFDDKQDLPQDTVEKIKIGDQEFDQKELEELVGIGRATREIEQKYNTKMDRVYPEYIKTTQELKEAKEYKEKYTTLEQQIESQKQGINGLTPEQREEARKQLISIFGDEPLTKKDADAWYQTRRSQEKLAESIDNGVQSLISEIKKDGKPEVSREDLLTFMGENNIPNADVAYKIMKEKEIDEWKMNKLKSGTHSGLHTITGSSAGGKQPLDVRPTSDNFQAMVHEALGGEE